MAFSMLKPRLQSASSLNNSYLSWRFGVSLRNAQASIAPHNHAYDPLQVYSYSNIACIRLYGTATPKRYLQSTLNVSTFRPFIHFPASYRFSSSNHVEGTVHGNHIRLDEFLNARINNFWQRRVDLLDSRR